jgi:para-aminobenzoate synthetase/4-amino-4-deoxychorismate lyase
VPGLGAVDVLAALFPGGSVTGAPKLRSMEAIAELEGEGRGYSFGALGFVDARGGACWNLLIRTLIWRPRPDLGPGAGEVAYRVGGGITWGSRAGDEERESLVKGEVLARVLCALPQAARSSPAALDFPRSV